jgi:8-oxo-dGTP diphosphatase
MKWDWSRAGIALYRRSPPRLRRALVHASSPSYAVGALAIVERPDGRVLLVRQSYRDNWFLPGGLLARGETPEEAARREAREEVNLTLPASVRAGFCIDPPIRVVTVFLQAKIDAAAADAVAIRSAEIVELGWWSLDALPPLNSELENHLRGTGLLGR